jgi:hypothetical protein
VDGKEVVALVLCFLAGVGVVLTLAASVALLREAAHAWRLDGRHRR